LKLKEIIRWFVWGLAFPLVFLNGWLILLAFEQFRSLITIFISANLFAFVLNHAVQWLQRLKIKRIPAISLVFSLTLSSFLLLGLTLAPIAGSQLSDFIHHLPDLLKSGDSQLQAIQNWAIVRRVPIDLTQLLTQVQDGLSTLLQTASGQIFGFGLGVVGITFDLLLTLVMTLYLLMHGDRLWDGLYSFLPESIAPKLRHSFRENFRNYFLGQATLACLVGILVTLAFLILRVPFGLLFGLSIGLLALFPFGTPFGIYTVSVLVALQDFWLGIKVLIIASLIDQAVQNGIAPRLLGRFTGLNPVWVLISILLGVRVGGLIGLLVAVPTAGVIKNVVEEWRKERKEEGGGRRDEE
jgi:predicted PurR-regulated permease PerM